MVHEPQLKPLPERPGALARADRPRADRRRQRGRRARQHHGDPLPRSRTARPGAGGGAPTGSRPTAPRSTRRSPARPRQPRQGVTKPTTAGDEAEAEYRRHGTVALQAISRTAGGAGPGPGRRDPPPERTARSPEGHGPRRRRAAPRRRLRAPLRAIVLPLLVGAWLATRAVYLVGADPPPRPDRRHLPRPPVRAAVPDRPLRAPVESRVTLSRGPPPAARRASPTTSCDPATTPRTSCRAREGQLEREPVAASSSRSPRLRASLTARLRGDVRPASEVLSNVSLTYGAAFLALGLSAHLVIRATLPYAYPYLFPLVAVRPASASGDLPDRRGRSPASRRVVRRRARPVRGGDRLPARRWATPLYRSDT